MGRDFTGSRGELRVGLYEFLRDVLLASIDKSQFPFALAAIIVLAVVWKLSPGDLAHLLVRLVTFAERRSIVGYVVGIISVFGWFLHVRYKNWEIAQMLALGSNTVAESEVGAK
jgi:hypothetical protein